MTVGQRISLLAQQLESTVDQPQLEAELLLAYVLKQSRAWLYTHPEQLVDAGQLSVLDAVLQRRVAGEPLAYIVGYQEFWSLPIKVNENVLIPRPETELLVETVLASYGKTRIRLAELGTGSGAISLALATERPLWEIFATDVSESALATAKDNAQRLALNSISFCSGSWLTALPGVKFDVIVSNPPYIAESEWAEYQASLIHEPRLALTSGKDGLDAIRQIVREALSYLEPGGQLLIEHGYQQGDAVRYLFDCEGYQQIQTIKDLSLNDRVTMAKSPGG